MSIEKQITELTAAIRALTAAVDGNTAALVVAKADPHAEDDAYRRGMQAARAAQSKAPDAAAPNTPNGNLPPAPTATVTQTVTFPSPAKGEPLDYTKHVRPVMTHVISTKGSATVRTILERLGKAKATDCEGDVLAEFYDALKAQL